MRNGSGSLLKMDPDATQNICVTSDCLWANREKYVRNGSDSLLKMDPDATQNIIMRNIGLFMDKP